MCELVYVTFPPNYSQLAAVLLALPLCSPWGSPDEGAIPHRALCVLGDPSLWGEGSFPGWQAAAVAVSRVQIPLQPASATFQPSKLPSFLCVDP